MFLGQTRPYIKGRAHLPQNLGIPADTHTVSPIEPNTITKFEV